jgi:hypothetical protein
MNGGKVLSRSELSDEVIRLHGDIKRLHALAYRFSVLLAVLEYARTTVNFTYVPSTTCPTKTGGNLNVRSEDPTIFRLPSLDAMYHQDLVRQSTQGIVE